MRFLLFCFCLVSALGAFERDPSKKICLNMIVKNESPVIRRCLRSALPFIDYWVVVDTGSTDGTQQIIRDFLKDIPGELHERPWVNFAANRNEAMALCKGKGELVPFDERLRSIFDSNDLFCLRHLSMNNM